MGPPMGIEPNAPPGVVAAAHDEQHAAPPFLTWRAIYTIVLGALAVQIAIYAALTAFCR
jgi:hypothetical protein